jgi:hypothetical protein
MASRDLILTTLHRVSFESVAAFLLSLKRTGYSGQVVAFVSAMEEESVARLRSSGISIEPFRFHGRGVRQRLARPWGLWRGVFASGLSPAMKERLAHLVFHLFYRRHLLYLQYLRRHGAEYDRVFLTDCRDVYFQTDPFSWEPERGVHFFLEETPNKIGQCPHNRRWISSQFGREMLDQLKDETVSCAGTTFGDIASLSEYLSLMVSVSMKALSLKEHDGDQGIHNFILKTQQLRSKVIVHDNREGPVMTLGVMRMADVRFNAQGLVVNAAGQVVPVLHQYDRIPELKSLLLDGLHRR